MSIYKSTIKKYFKPLPEYLGKVINGNYFLAGAETIELLETMSESQPYRFKLRILFYFSCSPILEGLRVGFQEIHEDSRCLSDKDYRWNHIKEAFHKKDVIGFPSTTVTIGGLHSFSLLQKYSTLLNLQIKDLFFIIGYLPVDMAPKNK
ncbi:MAG: hypothetical protein FJZ04_03615 [Candidatus Moranbacteria bacterium]|nr:hypothetical protein [Candidatus Moranbacteria bacterium]